MASWRRSAASDEETAEAVRASAWPLRGESSDYSPLLDAVGESSVVLLGAATEGTHEFNRERMALTQRLIVQKGFRIVAAPVGWSDAYRVNRFIHGVGFDDDPEGALSDFKRFPAWCWRNSDALDFVAWLRQYNDSVLRPDHRVSFFGLDLYSLRAAMALACRWLQARDGHAARRASRQFGGFDRFGGPRRGLARECLSLTRTVDRELIAELLALHRRGLVRHAILNNDDAFLIEQSARLIEEAEVHYRCLLHGGADSWNIYERHLSQTAFSLLERFEGNAGGAKMVIWGLNSHLGDAAAVSAGGRKRTSLGHLLREQLGEDLFIVGCSTHEGTVTAARDWDGPADCLRLRPAPVGSLERVCHLAGAGDFLLLPGPDAELGAALRGRRLERVVGVVYQPDEEPAEHWFEADAADQFDALLHFDRTRAVEAPWPVPAVIH